MSHWSDNLSRQEGDRILTLLDDARIELTIAGTAKARGLVRDIERLLDELDLADKESDDE